MGAKSKKKDSIQSISDKITLAKSQGNHKMAAMLERLKKAMIEKKDQK